MAVSQTGSTPCPRAQNYSGVWIEQLAESMPSKPEVKQLARRGNELRLRVTRPPGWAPVSSPSGRGTSLFVDVENIGQQITDYLATHPEDHAQDAFCGVGRRERSDQCDRLDGTTALMLASTRLSTSSALVDAGATQFIVPNLPPLGLVPRLNGIPATSTPATAASALYNQVLGGGIR